MDDIDPDDLDEVEEYVQERLSIFAGLMVENLRRRQHTTWLGQHDPEMAAWTPEARYRFEQELRKRIPNK